MALEPVYSPDVAKILDQIDDDPTRTALWNAICDAIDLICDHSGSAQARRHALRTTAGNTLWSVPVRYWAEDNDWVVLWRPRGDHALIAYIGPSTFHA